ncbi:MAG: RlmE family RNA methyltransferase [Deltaproteobacteria bacterium]|nr:RlmE family RNA methyltransferase [Deltaproteobacteria bacterium]
MGSKLGNKGNRHDVYFRKAKEQNFVSRAVYKLKETDEKYKILKKGMTVIDMGAAPGSWSQYAASKIGSSGKLISVDLNELAVSLPAWCRVFKSDFNDLDYEKIMEDNGGPFDVILSDMAPSTTGIKFTDCVRSAELVNFVLDKVPGILKVGGALYCKIFQGEDFDDTVKNVRALFKRVKMIKPDSSRSESKELFIYAWERK